MSRRSFLEAKCRSRNTYQTKQDAARSASIVRSRNGTRLVPYNCEVCGLWHNFAPSGGAS